MSSRQLIRMRGIVNKNRLFSRESKRFYYLGVLNFP